MRRLSRRSRSRHPPWSERGLTRGRASADTPSVNFQFADGDIRATHKTAIEPLDLQPSLSSRSPKLAKLLERFCPECIGGIKHLCLGEESFGERNDIDFKRAREHRPHHQSILSENSACDSNRDRVRRFLQFLARA